MYEGQVSLGFILVLAGCIGAGIVTFIAWPSKVLAALAICVVVVALGVLLG